MMLCWLSLIFSVAKSAVFLWNWATLTLLLRVVFYVCGLNLNNVIFMECEFYQGNPTKKTCILRTPPPHPECDFKGDGFEYQFGGFCCENLATLTIFWSDSIRRHNSVSNCFHYVVTIALFLQIFWYVLSYLCVFDLNHSSVHLWRMHAVKRTLLANHSIGIYFRVYSSSCLLKLSVLKRGVKNRIENRLLLLNYDVFM